MISMFTSCKNDPNILSRFMGALVGVIIWTGQLSANAGFVGNADFSDGLNQWTTSGNVINLNQEALIGDDGSAHNILYQGVAVSLGTLMVDFDFRNLLSGSIPMGTFPDSFFVSMYAINDINLFDLQNNVFDDELPLMDLDANGVFNNMGTIEMSMKGPDWLHFSATFENTHNYVIPVFELFDLNLVQDDSAVLVDNVRVIPEPRSVTLVICGLLVYGSRLNRMRKCVN